MFSINEKVVYPGHGVAKVDRLVDKRVAHTSTMFYELVFINKEMTILVPVSNSDSIGVRRLSTRQDIETIFAILSEPPLTVGIPEFFVSSWNKRSKTYQGKIRSGNLIEIAKIYRDINHLSRYKELSFGERSLLQQTEVLLVEEISLVYNVEAEEALARLRMVFML